MYYRRGPSILGIIYIVIGIFVAADHNYFNNIESVEDVLSAALALLLWPLVLLDVNLRIKG
jgi:hypothetical protein